MLTAQGSKLMWQIEYNIHNDHNDTLDHNVSPGAIDLGYTSPNSMTPTGEHCKVSQWSTLYTLICV